MKRCLGFVGALTAASAFLPAARAAETPVTPRMEIVHTDAVRFGSADAASQVQTWDFQSSGVSSVTIRLVQVIGGKVIPLEEQDVTWRSAADTPIRWSLSLLFAGQVASRKEKQTAFVPQLAVRRTDEGVDSEQSVSLFWKPVPIKPSGVSITTFSLATNRLEKPGETVLFLYKYADSPKAPLQRLPFASKLSELQTRSLSGERFLAVALNWKAVAASEK